MPICGVVGCSKRPGVDKEFSFHKVPTIIRNQGDETLKLSEERRRLWKGKKAYLHDRTNPDWVPTLFMGLPKEPTRNTTASDRFSRVSARKEKRKAVEAASSLISLKKQRVLFRDAIESSDSESNCMETDIQETSNPPSDETVKHPPSKEVQTELTRDHIQQLEDDNKAKLFTSSVPTKGIYSFSYYENDPERVSFYTGLPNIAVLRLVFHFIMFFMSDNKSLSKEQEFLLCLVKLRLDYLFKDIAYSLDVSLSTVQRSFHDTLDLMNVRLSFLVKWPSRETLRNINANEFSQRFWREGWGGRTSDKFITEKSGILQNLLPGDIVMTDRGFCIEESVRFYGAELAIPNFTRGKSQLHPLEVEKTRRIASVRIHVERVIGLVLRKFRIFDGIIPLEFVKLRNGSEVPTIDKIVKVACCLTNLCASVVPFDQ
ncbi:hypothetical protein FSP39_010421 [Pinctada imbricata]|uniref:DDE Tnp4 domain-containing protein n=1 Tax=Pinctada imbricata TaxID=66713 RepID=A0AA88XL20_PINIB|nr:hypothetical protein FSP39_010421 [Pinctada imbricata]